jgi:hypothetical protein
MGHGNRGDVFFVGSVPGASAEEVFRRCSRFVDRRAFAFPDGELGPRQMWCGGLGEMVYSKHRDLERLPDTYLPFGTYAPREGLTSVSFDELYPYTEFALESYRTFRHLRDAGELPADARFQVSLPTSYAAIASHFTDMPSRRALIDSWAHAMRRGYDDMLAEIPAEDLVIQLDYCIEFVDIHGDIGEDPSLAPGASRDEKIRTYTEPAYIAPMSENLPEGVTLGYHICAGTFPKWPLSQLKDLSLVVAIANRLVESTPRRIDFLHLPVMAEADEAYFAPLRQLTPGPRVFLGLECRDGAHELRRRTEAAQQHISDFGIAHFCGYGREYADQVDELLADLAAGADALSPHVTNPSTA